MGDDVDHVWQPVKGRKRPENKGQQRRIDIATSKNLNREKSVNLTTYFFTDFPKSFGANAMFNAFQYYGDIIEVVIPAKLDKGGRRFGFARFNHVTDVRRFAIELDNMIIGRDKISVNLSRFHRHVGVTRQGEGTEGRQTRRDSRGDGGRMGEGHRSRSLSRKMQQLVMNSYAQVVKRDRLEKQASGANRILFSYEAAQEDMDRLHKAFVGDVAQSGMSYNIQEAFHMQGYFGVKVTPMGSKLVLLEGQEEGEVEALMDDAKEWLDQWFSEIRPWSPDEIDNERTIWLRIYGIPSHAWNDNFFAQVVNPWGTFIKADDGTMKKTTLDVARLMIRTSCQQVVDEFIDVKINGKIFHLRVLEDSYGPMRIIVHDNKNASGRDNDGDSIEEEEEDDEEDRRLLLEEEEVQGQGLNGVENLVACSPVVNSNDGAENNAGSVDITREGSTKVKSKLVEEESPNNLEVHTVGSQNSVASSGVGWKQKRGVYSDGLRLVYNKLNIVGPTNKPVSCPIIHPQESTGSIAKRIHPIPAKIRKQNLLINKYNLRTSSPPLSLPDDRSTTHVSESVSHRPVLELVGVTRNSPSRTRKLASTANSVSSAGAVLCCSFIGSAEI
jgi:hypothetical protein